MVRFSYHPADSHGPDCIK